MSFSYYNKDIKKFKEMYPSYLQSDGTQLMNTVQLKFDLLNEFKNRVVEFWELFDIDRLEANYISDRLLHNEEHPGIPWDDNKWVYTGFLENICRSYEITREYYSYYANDEKIFGSDEDWVPPGNVTLNNLNMIRLLKIRRAASGYDGTRESLVGIIRNALNNKYLNTAGSDGYINIFMRTVTEAKAHATLQVYIIRPAGDSVYWSELDDFLAYDGEYFVELLGIAVNFEVNNSDTMIYDIGEYDEDKYR